MKNLPANFSALILFFCITFFYGCDNSQIPPQNYTAKFETTKGNFEIEVQRKFSPKAADRFYQMIESGYYDNTYFYRVVPNFAAQFGATDPDKIKLLEKVKVPDEKVLYSNKKGTISFARLGKESRGFDLFINLEDNTYLDTINFEGVKGYPAFGKVTKGMEIVEKLYSGYGETTMEDEKILAKPHLLRKAFPNLDRIKRAYIVK